MRFKTNEILDLIDRSDIVISSVLLLGVKNDFYGKKLKKFKFNFEEKNWQEEEFFQSENYKILEKCRKRVGLVDAQVFI